MVGLRAAAVAGLLLVAAPATAMTSLAPLPVALSGATAVWDGTDIHILGGMGPDGPYAPIVRFDPAAAEAVATSAVLTDAAGAAAVWTGSHVAIFGGWDPDGAGSRDVRLYDPANGTIDVHADVLPENQGVSAAVWDGQRAYLFLRSALPMPVYVYQDGEAAPAGGVLWEGWNLAGVAAIYDGRHAWLFGGAAATPLGVGAASPIVWRYDPAMDRMEPIAQLPAGLAWAAAATDGELVYLAGGLAVDPVRGALATDAVLAFDPTTRETGRVGTLPEPAAGAAAVWADALYVFGGGAWEGVAAPILEAGVPDAHPTDHASCLGCGGGGGGGWTPIVDPIDPLPEPEEEEPEECACDPPAPTPAPLPPGSATPHTQLQRPLQAPPTIVPVDGCDWSLRLDGTDTACDMQPPVGDEAISIRPAASTAGSSPLPGPVGALLALEAIALAAVAGFLWRHRHWLLTLPLFTRLQKDSLLDHPVRALIHSIVEAEPGIHYNALLRRAASGRGALDHHLKALVDHGLLHEHATTGYRCYFITGAVDRRVMAARAALRADLARELLENLCRHPGDSIGALAERTGVTPSAAAYHLHRFADVGLVELTRRGRRVEVHPGPVASQVLATA